MKLWRVEFLPEAQDDLSQLDQSVRPEVLKAIRKVSQNPGYPDGYGKPRGHLSGSDLSGLYKIKFRKTGLRVVYGLQKQEELMTVIIISVREDFAVYEAAEKRRKKYGL